MSSSTKTSRTGFTSEKPALRQRYAEARSAGQDHEAARRTAAKGLPLHMVDDWTADLQETFDGAAGNELKIMDGAIYEKQWRPPARAEGQPWWVWKRMRWL